MIKLEFILFTFIHFLKLVEALLTMIWNNAKKGTLLHVKYIYISAPDKLITITVQNKRCKLRTPWPIHFKLRIVIGIDSLNTSRLKDARIKTILYTFNFLQYSKHI
jgi:hypothetical protein